MRVASLLLGLCLAVPVLTVARADPACDSMLMPPELLREVSRGFGHGHTGTDLMAPMGSPIRAAAGGTVMYAGWYFDYGNIVDIRHTDGLITRYAHMSAFAPGIVPGAPVAEGAVIGRVGMTGRAHGPHVHFEVRVDGKAHPVPPAEAGAAGRSPRARCGATRQVMVRGLRTEPAGHLSARRIAQAGAIPPLFEHLPQGQSTLRIIDRILTATRGFHLAMAADGPPIPQALSPATVVRPNARCRGTAGSPTTARRRGQE
jgi:murein DD-endopeptidase MepM/ murein hydrolase activator NlpD